jgi:hypothetical protein
VVTGRRLGSIPAVLWIGAQGWPKGSTQLTWTLHANGGARPGVAVLTNEKQYCSVKDSNNRVTAPKHARGRDMLPGHKCAVCAGFEGQLADTPPHLGLAWCGIRKTVDGAGLVYRCRSCGTEWIRFFRAPSSVDAPAIWTSVRMERL